MIRIGKQRFKILYGTSKGILCLAVYRGIKIENKTIKRFPNKSFVRKAIYIMLIILAILLVCVIILIGMLLAWSPGKPEPFLAENGNKLEGSISEKNHVKINGMEQGMFIKSKNNNNPVLLLVHGGPGMPEYFLTEKYPTGLENYFTICYWEQRGAGLSYNADTSPTFITVEQLISDTLAVTDYLRERFGQEKVYLMGHSWGSYIGIKAVAQAPEKYNAYIGMSQISQQLESEKLAYEYMLEQYTAVGNTKMVQKLKSYSIYRSDAELHSYLFSLLRDEAMHDLGIGTMHNMKSVISGIFLPIMQCRAYTLGEKIDIWRGKVFSRNATNLVDKMYSEDLTTEVSQLDMPVYFFSGIHDYTVSYTLAADYLKKLQAPKKGFYTFEQSAHSPLFEEPEKFLRIMLEDVLNGAANLSDTK